MPAVKAAQIEVLRCSNCGKLLVPPAYGCSRCGSGELATTSVVAEGDLYTFTKIWMAPAGFEGDVPYTVAVVELADGLLLPTRIAQGQDDALSVGQRVRLAGQDDHGYIFEPVS